MVPFHPNFNDFFCQHFIEVMMALYLLAYISYAIAFSSSNSYLSFFPISKQTTFFSIFFLFFIIVSVYLTGLEYLYSVDLAVFNKVFFPSCIKIFVLLSIFCLLIISRDYAISKDILSFEYDLLIFFSILGLTLLTSCDDFIMLYVAIELQSLCFYVLAAFLRKSDYSIEAGLKYFILGALSSGFLLFGLLLIYVSFGILSFEALTKIVDCSAFSVWGYSFILAAFCFKVGAVPFHM